MDDKIKAYVKNNIRKTAQTYLKIAKQPIEQAKFIGSVGREVAKAPAFLGKTAATGLIKIPTQVATNGRVDLAKNKYIGKAFMTDKQINQVSATPTAPLKFLGQNVLAGAKTAATAFGAPAMATRQGLTSLGASSLLGGGLNKAMGQDARQGAVQGAALAPTIAGITRYSNPLIEQGVAKFAPRIAGKMPNLVKEGIARIPGNVAEGAVIDATLNRRPLSIGSTAIDAATSFIPGGPNIRNRKQQLDNVDVVKPWQKAFNAAKDNKVADKLIMTIRGYETIKKAGGTTKQFESVFREASEFFLPEKARNLPLDEQVNVWKYILNRHAGSSIDVDVPQILKDVDMMYRPQSLGLGIVEDGKLKNNPQPNVAQRGGIKTSYTPEQNLKMAKESGRTFQDLAKDSPAMLKGRTGFDKVPDTVTVYRATSQTGRGINAGDWVTTDPNYAKTYGGVVESIQVPAKDIRYMRGSAQGNAIGEFPEYIYTGKSHVAQQPFEDIAPTIDATRVGDVNLVNWIKANPKSAGTGTTKDFMLQYIQKEKETGAKGLVTTQQSKAGKGFFDSLVKDGYLKEVPFPDSARLGYNYEYTTKVDAFKSKFSSPTPQGKPLLSDIEPQKMYHVTSSDNASKIRQEGFKPQIGERSLGVANAKGTWFYENADPTGEFGKNFTRVGKIPEVIEANINGKVFDALDDDRSIRALVEDKKLISKLKSEGYVGIKGDELGTPATFIFEPKAIQIPSSPTTQGKPSIVQKAKEVWKDQRGFINIGADVTPKLKTGELPQSTPQGQLPSTKSSLDNSISQGKAFNINTNRLKMNKKEKKVFVKQVEKVLPELEKAKGKKLTFDEVTEEAQKADLLKKAIGRETTANFEAQLTKTRQRMVELNKQIDNYRKTGNTQGAERLTMELIQHIKSVSGAAADAGRRLGSFRITAEARPFREQLLDEIIKNQKYSDEQADNLVRAAARVDFNDPAQVTRFFKEVVKPTVGQMLEEYRYINLLSSPRTHLTNIFSNAIQTGVLNPATKLTTGIVDPIASVLTGKARENYIGEVPMYYRGMLGSFPDAFTALSEVFQGKRALTNLDFKTLQRMPSKANIITKSLEGFDVFFRTLIEGGEKQALDYKFGKMGKEAGEGVINNIAEQRGQYYTFRQGFDNPGQGAALDWFDKGTQAVMQLRRVPGVSWFVPFIQTPMNIVKQGFEYSPAGFSTMAKADNKTEQFSKALLGSAVFAGAGYLALNDRLTYAAPRDPEQKKLFYASGKQPYSVKVGDKWVSFSKIGPLAYPLALAGAIKYSFEDNPSAITDDTFEKTTKALTGAVGFFADQSYMQGIGNMIKALEGQEGFNFSKIAGNVATQYVPLASLQRWVNNIIDPIYRKPKTFVDNIKSSVIGQTGDMGYYEDPLGEPSKRQFPLQNAFSPVGITQENPEWNPLLDMRQQELQGNAILNKQEKNLQEKVGLNPASADSGDTKMDAYTAKMQEKMARNRVELLGESERIGDKIIYQTESGTGTLDLGKVTSLSEDNKYLKAIKNSKAYTLSGDILDADISEEEKNQALKDIGISRDDAEYYSIASQSNDLKSIYLLEVAQAFVNNSGNRQDMIDVLVSQRRKVNGDMIASDGVLDNLYNDGYITNEERKALKDIDFDAEGKLKVKPSSGGKKLKAVKAPTYKLSRKARQKLRKPKLASIKLEGSKKLKTTKPKKFAPIKLVNSKK